MKKQKIKTIFLILLPVFAASIAMNPGSVILWDAAAEKLSAGSYFALLPEGTFQLSTVLAALLTCLSGGLSITYMVGKKEILPKVCMYLSFAAATLAIVPVLIYGQIRVLPNMGLPILMIAHAVLAYFMPEKKKEQGKKLNKH